MNWVDFSEERFNEIVSEYKKFVEPLGIPDVNCIPLSALDGDNVVDKSERTPWYKGISLLDFLETVHIDNDHNFTDFRFPVQYVLRPNLDFRGFCGKVASGIVRKGDTVMALPSGKTSKVKSIVTYDGELDYAFPPQSVTLTLEDEIDVSRGEMLVHPDNLPIVDRNFEAMMVWMDPSLRQRCAASTTRAGRKTDCLRHRPPDAYRCRRPVRAWRRQTLRPAASYAAADWCGRIAPRYRKTARSAHGRRGIPRPYPAGPPAR